MSASTLLLDVGNSSAKWFHLSRQGVCRHGGAALDALPESLGTELEGACVLISSVASKAQDEALADRLKKFGCAAWFAQSRASLDGLVNSYVEPERMGTDRWLAMLGARQRARGRLCVVDAGSALTIDLVAEDGQHEGGYIIPGVALMERALFSDTQRVRYTAPVQASIAPGRSTAEAVGHGALLAQAGAIRLAIEKAQEHGAEPELFLCGGGASQLQMVLGDRCTLARDLVFQGLLRQAQLEGPQALDFEAIAESLGASSD